MNELLTSQELIEIFIIINNDDVYSASKYFAIDNSNAFLDTLIVNCIFRHTDCKSDCDIYYNDTSRARKTDRNKKDKL